MGSCSHGYHQGKNMAINKNEFYEKYAPIAIEQQLKYGIPAAVTLARWDLKVVSEHPDWPEKAPISLE